MYKIIFKGIGFTSHFGFNVRNYKFYNSFEDIPTFDENEHPITEGLKKLSKSDKLDIVDANEKPEGLEFEIEAEDPLIEDAKKDAKQDIKPSIEDTEEDTIEDTSEEVTEEVDSKVEVKNTIEFDGEEIELTEESLNELTSKELDEVCKENELSGYSTLKKDEKITLILDELK